MNPSTEAAPGTGLVTRLSGAARRTVRQYQQLGAVPGTRRLLLAATGSYIGDRFNTIALIALSYKLGDGALGVGVMLALFMLPRSLIQAPAGALVDRHPGPRLLILSHVLLGVLGAAFALLDAIPNVWFLYGLVLAMGTVRTVAMPAFEVQLMAVTPPEQYGTANALHTMARTMGELVGPLLGGLLLALTGAIPLFLLNGLSFLLVAGAVLRGRRAATTTEGLVSHEPEAAPAGGLGYRALLRNREVLLYISLTVTNYALVMGAIAIFVVRARSLGLGDAGVGLFYAALGIGALVGGLVAGAGNYQGSRVFAMAAGAAVVGAVGIALFGVASGVLLAMAALVLNGVTGDLEEVAALTGFQHRLPAAVYGRFFSLFLMATGLGGVIGSLVGPALAEEMGAGASLTLLAVPVVALAVPWGLHASLSGHRLPAPTLVPAFEPEVVGYGLFGVPSESDLIADGRVGGPSLAPRMSRLA